LTFDSSLLLALLFNPLQRSDTHHSRHEANPILQHLPICITTKVTYRWI
jgi:hypothetical protein